MDPTYRGLPIPTPSRQPVTGRSSNKLFWILGFAVVGAIIAGVLLFLSGSNPSLTLESHLSSRLGTLSAIVAEGQDNLSDGTLKKINSDVMSVISSDSVTLQAAFAADGLNLKKLDKTIVASEADEATFTKLKTAKINGQFDETYRPILTAKLESTNALVKELYDTTKSTSLKKKLNVTYGHVQVLQNELAASGR